jgi:Riboflavin kinase
MRVEEADIPLDGVYVGYLVITGSPRTRLPAAISVGCNPTFAGPRRTIEAHVLDFDGDLYGRRVESGAHSERANYVQLLTDAHSWGAIPDCSATMARMGAGPMSLEA